MNVLKLSPSECWQNATDVTVSPLNTDLDIAALEFGFGFGCGYRVALVDNCATIPQVLMNHFGKLFVYAVNDSDDVIASGEIWVHYRPTVEEGGS
jgi:hypothetical protein